MRVVLQLFVAILSGGAPISWVWAYYAPLLLACNVTAGQVWCAAMLCYFAHGSLIEMLPFDSLQPNQKKLDLAVILPQTVLNLSSSIVFVHTDKSLREVSDAAAIFYLVIAALGNEIIYACVHRLCKRAAIRRASTTSPSFCTCIHTHTLYINAYKLTKKKITDYASARQFGSLQQPLTIYSQVLPHQVMSHTFL